MAEGITLQEMDEETVAKLAKKDEVGALPELLTTAKDSTVAAINELFTNVSNGKTSVAAAITDKGIAASGSDTFVWLAAKIAQLQRLRTNYSAFEGTLKDNMGPVWGIGATAEGTWYQTNGAAKLATMTGTDAGVTWYSTGLSDSYVKMFIEAGILYVFFFPTTNSSVTVRAINRAGTQLWQVRLSPNITWMTMGLVKNNKIFVGVNQVIKTYAITGELITSYDSGNTGYNPSTDLGFFEDDKYIYLGVGNNARYLAINKHDGTLIKTNSSVINMV
ncbi:hypothetical protein D3C76_106190 [compost metagenome]